MDIKLEDKYKLIKGTRFLTGAQALVRVPIVQARRDKRKNLNRLMTEINSREAAIKALNITKINDHSFKVEIDAEASRHLFPSNERLKK